MSGAQIFRFGLNFPLRGFIAVIASTSSIACLHLRLTQGVGALRVAGCLVNSRVRFWKLGFASKGVAVGLIISLVTYLLRTQELRNERFERFERDAESVSSLESMRYGR